MKQRIIVLLITLGSFTYVRAQNYATAIGIRFSSNDATVNTGITAKHFFNNAIALEGLMSFTPFAIGALIEKHNDISGAVGLQWFYGGGAYVAFSGDRIVGAQGVAGLDYKFANIPINLSLDWKPELNFITDLSFEPAAVGLSARFTLK